MIILPEIYILLITVIVKIIFLFKNKFTNPLIFIFLGFELIALIPSLLSYSNGLLYDPSYQNYPVNSENIRSYLIVYLILEFCLIFATNRPFKILLRASVAQTAKGTINNLLFLNGTMVATSALFSTGNSYCIVMAMIMNTYISLLQARIAISLVKNNTPRIYSFIYLSLTGPAYVYLIYKVGISEDLSRLSLVWPFLIYGVFALSTSQLNKGWGIIILLIFLLQNSLQTIVGGGDFLIVKHGVNVAAAVSNQKIETDAQHLFYNTGFQLIAPALGLGSENNNSNSIYQRLFYNLSEGEISAAWGVGITLPADLILSFGVLGSLIAIIIISLFYRKVLSTIWGTRILNSPWAAPIHLHYALKIFAALRMDASILTSMLVFDVFIIIFLLSNFPKLIK